MTAGSFTNEKSIRSDKTGNIFAGFAMALGLSFHFFGYECARAASISLLGAKVIFMFYIYMIFIRFSSIKLSVPPTLSSFISTHFSLIKSICIYLIDRK